MGFLLESAILKAETVLVHLKILSFMKNQMKILADNKSFNYAGFSNLPDFKSGASLCFFEPVNSIVMCKNERKSN